MTDDELLVVSDRLQEEGWTVPLWMVVGLLVPGSRSGSASGSASASWSRSGSASGSASASWSRSGSWSRSWSASWSRSGSRSWSRSWSDFSEEDEMKVGDTGWFRCVRGEDIVGRVVAMDALTYTLAGAVLVHDLGTAGDFLSGRFEGADRRCHVSRMDPDPDEEVEIPRIGTQCKRWRGDLAELRAWADM